MNRRRTSIEEALFQQACASIRDGSRFQFRVNEIGGELMVQKFIVRLSIMLGTNVRASCFRGLVTLYDDNSPDGTVVVVATIKHETVPG